MVGTEQAGHRPQGQEVCVGRCRYRHEILTIVLYSAYCHGVALGLYNLAKNEEKAEAQRTVELEKKRIETAVKEEAKRRQQELDRLKAPATPAVVEDCKPIKVKLEEVEDEERTSLPTRFSSSAGEQSNMKEDDGSDNEGFGDYGGFGSHPGHADFDDDDDLDDLIDLDAAVPKARVKPDPMEEKLRHEPLRPPSPVRDSSPIVIVKDEDDDVKPEWSSHKQLIQFRNDAEAIADQYLKSQKSKDGKPLKLCNGRKRPGLDLRDRNARDAFYKGMLHFTTTIWWRSPRLTDCRQRGRQEHRRETKAYHPDW